MTDSLYAEPEKDGFKKESPIRAFTEFKTSGDYAIGKGFRPSLAHLVEYLDALARKENWRLVQLLEAATGAPTMVFAKGQPQIYSVTIPPMSEFMRGELGEPYVPVVDPTFRSQYKAEEGDMEHTFWKTRKWPLDPESALTAAWAPLSGAAARDLLPFFRDENVNNVSHFLLTASVASMRRALDKFVPSWDMKLVSLDEPEVASIPFGTIHEDMSDDEATVYKLTKGGIVESPLSDPINPKHYNGRECADIGERLSANGYQILKYVWRLGKKDDPCVELGKAAWYAESEMALYGVILTGTFTKILPNVWGLPYNDNGVTWFEDRIEGQPQFTQNIARMLWFGYDHRKLQAIIEAITEHRFHLDCGRGLAV